MCIARLKNWLYTNHALQKSSNTKYLETDETIYVNDETHYEQWTFVWGVVSPDELLFDTANLYTLNDMDVCYNGDTGKYHLSVETAYRFSGYKEQVKYYEELLKKFTEYMKENEYPTKLPQRERTIVPICQLNADSIPELYVMFNIFVYGLRAVCEMEET